MSKYNIKKEEVTTWSLEKEKEIKNTMWVLYKLETVFPLGYFFSFLFSIIGISSGLIFFLNTDHQYQNSFGIYSLCCLIFTVLMSFVHNIKDWVFVEKFKTKEGAQKYISYIEKGDKIE